MAMTEKEIRALVRDELVKAGLVAPPAPRRFARDDMHAWSFLASTTLARPPIPDRHGQYITSVSDARGLQECERKQLVIRPADVEHELLRGALTNMARWGQFPHALPQDVWLP
jgi:hypothetical protein